MIFLFSNVKPDAASASGGFIRNVMPDDVFILLNTAIPVSVPFIADHPNKVLIRRWHRKLRHYHGITPVPDQFRALYYLEGPEHNLPDAPWLDDYSGYPELIPTTGFWIWMLLRDGFLNARNDVFLVNFAGSRDETTFKAKVHNWAFEEQFIRANHDAGHLLDMR
jgi:hypothetical protein